MGQKAYFVQSWLEISKKILLTIVLKQQCLHNFGCVLVSLISSYHCVQNIKCYLSYTLYE